MTASWAELPPPRDDDDDDVAWALQTAQVQWQRGSPADAIVWLKRAADSAVECGARARAEELKVAAQQLTARFVSNSEQPSAPPSSRNPFLARDSLSDDPFGGASDDPFGGASYEDDGLEEIPIGLDDLGGEVEDSASRFAGEALRRISTAPPSRSSLPAARNSTPAPPPPPPKSFSPPSVPAPPLRRSPAPEARPSEAPRSSRRSSLPSEPPARRSSLPPPRITPEPPISSPSPSETELSLGLLAELESDEAGGMEPEPDVFAAQGLPLSEEVMELDSGEVTEIDPPDVMEHLSELPPAAPGEPSEQERERELRTSLSEELAPDFSREIDAIESARDRGLRPSLAEELAASLPPSMRPRDSERVDDDEGPKSGLADDLEPGGEGGLAESLEPDEGSSHGLAGDSEPDDELPLGDDAEELEDDDDDDDDEVFVPRPSSAAPAAHASTPAGDQYEAPTQVSARSEEPPRDDTRVEAPVVRGVSLLDVEGLEDLPEPAQLELARAALIETLEAEEELNNFGVALVTEGSVSIMPTIADAVCGKAAKGDVVFTQGTLDEGVLLRVVADEGGAEVAIWDGQTLGGAMKDCPWVDDELRVIADRFQALAGASLGGMGERLDDSLRALVTDRCEVVARGVGEAVLSFGQAVDGMYVVGAGRAELVDDSGAVIDELGPGDFLFPAQVLAGGAAPSTARAGAGGALFLKARRAVAHELLLSVPPLIEILAG